METNKTAAERREEHRKRFKISVDDTGTISATEVS